MIIQFNWSIRGDTLFIIWLAFDIADAKNDWNSHLINCRSSVSQSISWNIYSWLAQVWDVNSCVRTWECSCLKFITGHQMATSPLKCRSVMEPYSGTHEACLRICVGKWISGLDSKAGDSNGPRAVICWQRILQPHGQGRRDVCVCVCVRDRMGGPYHSVFTHSKLSWNNSLSPRPNNGAGCRPRAQAGA